MNDANLPDLGYLFYPAESPLLSAYSGLDVNIFDQPTEQHYDPERLTLSTVSRNGTIEPIAVTYPWHGKRELQLAPGRVILSDRKGKLVEAFVTGGHVMLNTMSGYLSCKIVSPVPIYRLNDGRGAGPESIAAAVVDKLEAYLAISRARWGVDQAGIENRLTSIDTVTLYCAGLLSVEQALEQTSSRLRGARFHEMLRGVKLAILTARRRGEWPSICPNLEDLLKAPAVAMAAV